MISELLFLSASIGSVVMLALYVRDYQPEQGEEEGICCRCGYPRTATARRFLVNSQAYCEPCHRWFVLGKRNIMEVIPREE